MRRNVCGHADADALRPIEAEDILRANRTMYAASVLTLCLGLALRLTVQIVG